MIGWPLGLQAQGPTNHFAISGVSQSRAYDSVEKGLTPLGSMPTGYRDRPRIPKPARMVARLPNTTGPTGMPPVVGSAVGTGVTVTGVTAGVGVT